MRMSRAWCVFALLCSLVALGEPRIARDSAYVGARGSWSVGLFGPGRWAFADRVELQVHPLQFLVAPNALFRVAHGQGDYLRLTGEYGFTVPTFGMRLVKGYLFPAWASSNNNVGWMVVPHLAWVVSGGDPRRDVWTVRAGVDFRIPTGPNSAVALDSFLAPLEVAFAAPLTGVLGHVGAGYDMALGDRFRLHGEAIVYVTGKRGDLFVGGQDVGALAERSQFIYTAHVGVDLAVGSGSRVTLGVYYGNHDQGAVAVWKGTDGYARTTPIRSHTVLPTVDFIWGG